MNSKNITLTSGAKLVITSSPFAISRELFQSIIKQAKDLKLDPNVDVLSLYKDIFCSAFSSKEIELCLWKCMERVTYNGIKVTEDMFEDVKAREDYLEIFTEVAKENVAPFVKTLMQQYSPILEKMKSALA